MERVAICTLVDADRAWLTAHVARQWAGIDFAGAEARVFACVQDADDPTVAALAGNLPWPVCCVGVPHVAELVDDLPGRGEVFGGASYVHPAFLHKIAVYREAVRQAALAEYGDWTADWFLWLDSDTVPVQEVWQHLRADFAATTGPMAPVVYAGLYPERRTGHSIPQYRSSGEQRYVELVSERLQHADFSGFGCTLIPRRIMATEGMGWETFGAYRYHRRHQLECGLGKGSVGMIGEDVWWFRRCEHKFGPALCLDTRCLCRHYHRDGSFWEHYPDGSSLPTRYVTAEVEASEQVSLFNKGHRGVGIDHYRAYVPLVMPGEAIRVSPEYAEALVRLMPEEVEIVGDEGLADVLPMRALGGGA